MSLTAEDGARAPARTPWACQLLVAFLVVDALERAVELGLWWRAHPDLGATTGLYVPNLPLLALLVVVDLMLVVFLLMRTSVGRWFGATIFGLHVALLTYDLAAAHPELWLYASTFGRVRVVVTVALDALVIGWLLSPAARAHLAVR